VFAAHHRSLPPPADSLKRINAHGQIIRMAVACGDRHRAFGLFHPAPLAAME